MALKGPDIPAQGNALGNGREERRVALKGRDIRSPWTPLDPVYRRGVEHAERYAWA